MEDLIAKIQGMTLSKTESQIADYILEHLDVIGLRTSTALAEDIGVSDTSIIRFIRRLGFRGYSDFRSSMTERLADRYTLVQAAQELSPGEKYVQFKNNLRKESLISDVGKYTISNLENSFAKLTEETVEKAVDIILSSHKHYVSGFRGAASCAIYMTSKLHLMVSDVIPLIHAEASAIEAISDITAEDCIILYSFPRYSEINFSLLKIAHQAGAKVILFTDRYTSPLANMSDIVLVVQVGGLGFTNSYVAPLSISEIILLALSSRNDPRCSERIAQIDRLISECRLY